MCGEAHSNRFSDTTGLKQQLSEPFFRLYALIGYILMRLRPLARLRLRTSRPSDVFILRRKPCFLLPTIFVGVFKCFFIVAEL